MRAHAVEIPSGSCPRAEIKAGIQEDPYDVDEMPVQPDHLDSIPQRTRTIEPDAPRDREHEPDSNQEVHEVQAGRREVKTEEHARPRRVARSEERRVGE